MATLTCINQTITNLTVLAKTLKATVAREIEIRKITSFATTARDQKAAEEIKQLFNKYQSDKSSVHNYHELYGPILSSGNISGILEIGLGTPNTLDDGLHSMNTNIATLQFGITKIRKGGWVVIEDITPMTIPLWELIMHLIPDSFKCHLIQSSESCFLFAIQKQ